MRENDILVYMKETGPQHLARLGDLSVNPEGFRRFNEIQKLPEISIFSTEGMLKEDGSINEEMATAEMFGLAGALINVEWEHVKTLDSDYVKGPEIPFDEKFWVAFQEHCIDMLGEGQDYLVQKVDKLMEMGPENWDGLPREERLVLRYLYIKQKLNGAAGFPSFNDLVTLYTRFAKVAYERFAEVKGRVMTPEEFVHALKHPSFNARLASMMTNHRTYAVPAVTTLHQGAGEEKTLDLNKTDLFMDTAHFDITDEDGGPVLDIKSDFIAAAREKTVEKVQADKTDAEILRCPVVYTGKFSEMTDWMFQQLSYHLNLEGQNPKEEEVN